MVRAVAVWPGRSSPRCGLSRASGRWLRAAPGRTVLLPQGGLKQCLADFRQQLAWVERLDVTSGQVVDPASQGAADKDAVDPENDFQREMSL